MARQGGSCRVDRPLGSLHPNGTFRYALNYGFLPGTSRPTVKSSMRTSLGRRKLSLTSRSRHRRCPQRGRRRRQARRRREQHVDSGGDHHRCPVSGTILRVDGGYEALSAGSRSSVRHSVPRGVHLLLDRGSAVESWRVYEDEATVAFLGIGQATAGHALVVQVVTPRTSGRSLRMKRRR